MNHPSNMRRRQLLAAAALPLAGSSVWAQAAQPARNIVLDMAQAGAPLDRFFDHSVGSDFPGTLIRDDCQAQLKTVVDELGFRYLRFHDIFHDVLRTVRRENGELVFDFTGIDKLYDALLAKRIRPFIELGFTPQVLATSPQTIFYWAGNTSHPEAQGWVKLIDAFGRHLIQRYGLDEVRKWYFEVWNEPNLDGFWERADQQAYFDLYTRTARALKALDAQLRVGGPSTAGAAWVPEFLAHAKATNTPVDFVTTHTYGVNSGHLDEYGKEDLWLSPDPDAIVGDVRRVREQIEASHLPVPALVLHRVEHQLQPARQGARLLHERRLRADQAAPDPGPRAIHELLDRNRSYFGKPQPSQPTGEIQVQLRRLPPGRYRVQQKRTGYHANDAHTAYLEMGSPPTLDEQQIAQMHRLTSDAPESQRELRVGANGSATLTLKMPSHDVVLQPGTDWGMNLPGRPTANTAMRSTKVSSTPLRRSLPRGACLCVLMVASAMACAAPAYTEARLSVTQETAGPHIEPAVYGHFAEHLGSGIYGGLWVGPESSIPNTRGWRRDVVAALRRLQVPVVRWPGGCFADDYDWRDGVGDPAKRPVRLNKFWGMVPETNRVGTHEFMDLMEQLGAEAYVAGNMGSMTPRAMAQWLEYMTSDSPSSLTEERRRNGRDKPWKLKYFGIGNESWGCGGNMRPEYQADLHRQYATFLHAPVVRVASGDGQGDDHLTEVMMERAGKQMDAITLHYYTVPGPWETKGQATGFDTQRWAETLRAAMRIEERIVATTRVMDKHDPDKRVALYVDEWGMWHDPEPGTNPAFLQQQNTLRDALVAALSFNVFHRHTERVKMANVAQMVNVLQATVLTDGPRMLLTPTYHVFDLYKPFKGATPLKLTLQAPRWRQGDVELPAVDATAARAADGIVWLALVNLDPRQPARVATNLAGAAQGHVLTAATMDAHNTFAKPQALVPARYAMQPGAAGLTLELPPKSIVVVAVTPPH